MNCDTIKPADDHQAQRPARRSIGAVSERDRQRAQQRRHRGHHDGTEALHAGVVNRLIVRDSLAHALLAKSTIMIPFFFTMPISMNMPM